MKEIYRITFISGIVLLITAFGAGLYTGIASRKSGYSFLAICKLLMCFGFGVWAIMWIVFVQTAEYIFVTDASCRWTVTTANFMESLAMLNVDAVLLYRSYALSGHHIAVKYVCAIIAFSRASTMILMWGFPPHTWSPETGCLYGFDKYTGTANLVIDMIVDVFASIVSFVVLYKAIRNLRKHLSYSTGGGSTAGVSIVGAGAGTSSTAAVRTESREKAYISVVKAAGIRTLLILIINAIMITSFYYTVISPHAMTFCLNLCAAYIIIITFEQNIIVAFNKPERSRDNASASVIGSKPVPELKYTTPNLPVPSSEPSSTSITVRDY
ncbi:hypothetical protein HK102_007856 [Quaeritorhiza haematococci]|nr:hypothetical protein HK102_007856 [Quaeritorhiza haematococci]